MHYRLETHTSLPLTQTLVYAAMDILRGVGSRFRDMEQWGRMNSEGSLNWGLWVILTKYSAVLANLPTLLQFQVPVLCMKVRFSHSIFLVPFTSTALQLVRMSEQLLMWAKAPPPRPTAHYPQLLDTKSSTSSACLVSLTRSLQQSMKIMNQWENNWKAQRWSSVPLGCRLCSPLTVKCSSHK